MGETAKSKLEKLLAKKQEIEAQIRQRRDRERREKDKLDTRRKVLAGAAVMAEAEKRPEFRDELKAMLGRFLIRDDERALFSLPPHVSSASKLAIVPPPATETPIEESAAQSA